MSRRFGDLPIAVLECQRCAGLWLGLAAFEEMLAAEARDSKPGISRLKESSLDLLPACRGYRPCVVCGDLMSRKNLAQGKSGVVVDLCGKHGIWFDTDELAQLIAWTRTGGLEDVRRDLARLVGSNDWVRKRRLSQEELAEAQIEPDAPSSMSNSNWSSSRRDVAWIQLLGLIADGLLGGRSID